MIPPHSGPGSSDVERPSYHVDRALREDLDRARLESAVAMRDAAAELGREIQATAPIDLGDIAAAVDRLEGAVIPSLGELQTLLSSPEAGVLRIEGKVLSDLLREGVEGQTVLTRGIVFLKHRKYASALEWWSLNRRGLAPETSKLHLLLLIMEALTHHWAGDETAAEATQKQVYTHPLYRRLSSRGS